jgi:hypothetical protein
MISKFFIERPILANVIAVLIVVIGAVALFALLVAQYPDGVPPTVQVTTRYPGRQCARHRRYRRVADRAAGQRRRELCARPIKCWEMGFGGGSRITKW